MPHQGGKIINIAGTTPVDDPEYRYKMPAVFGKVEGSGNGIKTAIPNISDVGLSLHREPAEVNKFFGCELGAQTTYAPAEDRAIVNGQHNDAVLQELVHKYVEKFVLCPNCRLPETDYKIKNGTIWHKCAACGAKEMVDMTHKLCKFILAEHKKKLKDAKKNKKDDKKTKKKKGKGGDDSDEDKKKKKKKDKKDGKKKAKSADGDKDYIKEALAGGKKEDDGLGSDDDAGSLASEVGVDDEGALQLAVEATKKYLAENPEAKPADIAELVTNQQMASALKSQQKVHIFVQAAFTPQFYKNKLVEKYATSIVAITNGNRIMERHLIAALELFSSKNKPKEFPVLIKQLYDNDALDEVSILDWADEGRTEYTLEAVDEDMRAALRGEAEPVVVWLQDEDSDEESSDED